MAHMKPACPWTHCFGVLPGLALDPTFRAQKAHHMVVFSTQKRFSKQQKQRKFTKKQANKQPRHLPFFEEKQITPTKFGNAERRYHRYHRTLQEGWISAWFTSTLPGSTLSLHPPSFPLLQGLGHAMATSGTRTCHLQPKYPPVKGNGRSIDSMEKQEDLRCYTRHCIPYIFELCKCQDRL